MSVRVVKHIDREHNNRVEFFFVDFDFYDGNNVIAKLFSQEFQMTAKIIVDGSVGIWYHITRLSKDSTEYELIWHEDVGNYIYSLKQDKRSISELEQRLKEPLNKSHLTAQHPSCSHIFRHLARKLLAGRQPSRVVFVQSAEKSDCAIRALDLFRASLK